MPVYDPSDPSAGEEAPPRGSPYLIDGKASRAPSLAEVALRGVMRRASPLATDGFSSSQGMSSGQGNESKDGDVDLDTLLGLAPGDAASLPDSIRRLISDSHTLLESESGPRRCTICRSAYIVPRTEWLEWWRVSKNKVRPGGSGDGENSRGTSFAHPLGEIEARQAIAARDRVESLVPFVRRGCSWACVPPKSTA